VSFPVATIDAAALRSNLAVVRRMAPRSRVIAVVKANGYGHGMIRVARALADADGLGVARLADAVALREAGVTQRILLLEGVFGAEQFALAANKHCEIVVHSFEQLATLEQLSEARSRRNNSKCSTTWSRRRISNVASRIPRPSSRGPSRIRIGCVRG
jgi:alanine racemase